MRIHRPSAARGGADHGWLTTKHTFSFADYHDPQHMGFRALRVINEDIVRAGAGFATHGHRDMEIVSYVLEGALEHRDTMGNVAVIRPGDVQRMSAGSGVMHSEKNADPKAPAHFLQIWVLPDEEGLTPSYEQKHFSKPDKDGRLALVASSDGRQGSVRLHADVNLYAGIFSAGQQARFALGADRHAWLHIVRGDIEIDGVLMRAGDGVSVSSESAVNLDGKAGGEVLLFDLA
jgi:quercetin 2,3-dioxygenase